MNSNLGSETLVAIILAILLILPALAVAQTTSASSELAKMRELRANENVLDASDHADRDAFRQAVEAIGDVSMKEIALWEVADVHLKAANRWPAASDNGYARRAIDAWTAYVDFALDQNLTVRVHQAVEYLQRSYIQATAYQEMFAAFPRMPPQYVNDKVVTRWEDRLRTCPAYGPPTAQPWVERACTQADCRNSVADFYSFVQIWLHDFSLRAEMKSTFAARADRVPRACRSL